MALLVEIKEWRNVLQSTKNLSCETFSVGIIIFRISSSSSVYSVLGVILKLSDHVSPSFPILDYSLQLCVYLYLSVSVCLCNGVLLCRPHDLLPLVFGDISSTLISSHYPGRRSLGCQKSASTLCPQQYAQAWK